MADTLRFNVAVVVGTLLLILVGTLWLLIGSLRGRR